MTWVRRGFGARSAPCPVRALALATAFSAAAFPSAAQPGVQEPAAPLATPLPGLTQSGLARFEAGQRQFERRMAIDEGLGPLFNGPSCFFCHRRPGIGGTGLFLSRFGRTVAGRFDPMRELGGTLRQALTIGTVTTVAGTHTFAAEGVPEPASIVARRRTQALFGLGLVDAVPDEAFYALAERQRSDPDRAGGRPNIVPDRVSGRSAVGRFGWKAQVATLLDFTALAFRDELGLTNPIHPDETCPQGDCRQLDFNPAPGLNDDGSRVKIVTEFVRLLAPPSRGASTPEVEEGAAVFREIGCATCHVERLTTGESRVAALSRVSFAPYSDFLLHDMGALGDGIEQEGATGREMRTAPLWGVGVVRELLHDGRASTLEEAVLGHDGQALPARERYRRLDPASAAFLIAFLESL